MSWRTKSKSGWLALGKPTSISLKPICTRVSNIRRLRAGSIGSMRAWLPSRRSTEHHSGAFSMRLSGQVRSGEREREERPVLLEGHALRGHGFRGHRRFLSLFRDKKKPPAMGRRSSGRTPMVAFAYIRRRSVGWLHARRSSRRGSKPSSQNYRGPVLRRSFRFGLTLGILAGLASLVVKMLGQRRNPEPSPPPSPRSPRGVAAAPARPGAGRAGTQHLAAPRPGRAAPAAATPPPGWSPPATCAPPPTR